MANIGRCNCKICLSSRSVMLTGSTIKNLEDDWRIWFQRVHPIGPWMLPPSLDLSLKILMPLFMHLPLDMSLPKDEGLNSNCRAKHGF